MYTEIFANFQIDISVAIMSLLASSSDQSKNHDDTVYDMTSSSSVSTLIASSVFSIQAREVIMKTV